MRPHFVSSYQIMVRPPPSALRHAPVGRHEPVGLPGCFVVECGHENDALLLQPSAAGLISAWPIARSRQ